MLNVKCEIWSIPLRQWSCVLISTCRFTWLPLKSFLHSLSRLFLFPHQVWILEQLSTPLCSEQVKKYERHDAKTKGSANQQIWWLSTKKFRFSIAVSAAAFFSYFPTFPCFYVKIYERFDCSILGGFYMLFAIETKSLNWEWQENEA